jgi:CheY-like chemotaxis protein
MEAVGRLAGGVAHDFNNLLTVIQGHSELLLARLPADDPTRKEIDQIRKAGERAAGLTRQLLAFSRRQVLQARVLDLNEVAVDMEKMMHRLIGEDIELITRLGPEMPHVKADPGQLEQVIMNLAVNARDAMPDGGRLILETADTLLDEGFCRDHPPTRPGRYVMLALTDTGTGMTPETRAHLFEPFFTTKEKGKGTGLGLATVYGIVKQSGGYIWAESEPGKGSTFRIYLPPVDAPARSHEPRGGAPATIEGSETILLVEDEPVVRQLARRILEMNGYTVLEAGDVGDARRLCATHPGPIQLLLTDVVMPVMSGRGLADALSGLRPGMRVLYMSGYTDDAVMRHGIQAEGVPFLQKPFTPQGLAAKVREVLDLPHD